MSEDGRADSALFTRRVRDLLVGPPLTCPAATTVAEAARRMGGRAAGSIIVTGAEGAPVGIVTDRDLRRLLAAGGDGTGPVGAIMSSPLVTVEPGALAVEALLAMTRRNIHHLPVIEEGRLLGVISSGDLVRLQGAHPVALAREIEAQPGLDGLVAAAARVPAVVRWLLGAGAGIAEIGRIVAELNDRLVRRAVELEDAALAAESGRPAPAPYAWLAAGSEGRREQTLRTDQDNGLCWDDHGVDPALAGPWFARLAERLGRVLVALGFPRCEGGFMADNPRWCQPLSVWRAHFESWMSAPTPQHVLEACIYLDFRPVAGRTGVAEALRDWVTARAPRQVAFLRHLARAVVDRRSPLGWLGRLAVERRGPHRGRLDLKAHGVFPLIQAARVHALALGVAETHTLERFRAAAAHGALGPAELEQLEEAYAVVGRLRLRRQLACLDAGLTADNHVAPGELSRSDRLLLVEAFHAISSLRRSLAERFQTAGVA